MTEPTEKQSYIDKCLAEYHIPEQCGNAVYLFILAFGRLIPEEDLKEAEYMNTLATLTNKNARANYDTLVVIKSCAKVRLSPFFPAKCKTKEQKTEFQETPTTEHLKALLMAFYREYELVDKKIIDARNNGKLTLPILAKFAREWIKRINETLDKPA